MGGSDNADLDCEGAEREMLTKEQESIVCCDEYPEDRSVPSVSSRPISMNKEWDRVTEAVVDCSGWTTSVERWE